MRAENLGGLTTQSEATTGTLPVLVHIALDSVAEVFG